MTNKGKGKGKDVTGKVPAGKRKSTFDDDKTGGARKRKNREVLKFFEDSADVEESDDNSDYSDFSDEIFDEDFDTLPRMMNEPSKGHSSLPFVPKEELVDEEEFDRMMEERYGDPSRFISFAGDGFDDKMFDPSSLHAGAEELIPTIWKVKCTVGRERLSACCLMQKFADLKSLGTTLQIISAFAVDHMKGFVYIEAEKQYDINEACQGIPGIYVTRVQPVPRNEVSHLFSVRSRSPEISEGMWTRIKSGNYKGDLAQVVAVNNTRKKITVKLIPRIDLQALAAKFGGGYSRQKIAVPAPRLISSSELEEFRPLIQFRRDRDTGKVFEVLDGLMLKEGYVYKKVSPDSLSLWGVVPTEEELLKFGSSENNESNDLEWLSQLYGDKKKKRVMRADKGGEKGESSSGSNVLNGFELYDLVCFGKKDFGVIIGMDKDDCYKILKDSLDGPVAVTIERHEIKSGLFDLKLSAQDQHSKTILVSDTIKVVEGPSKGKQGIVKHIYRGIVFLYDVDEEANGGYFTCKSNMCEKVKLAVGDCRGKDSEPGPLVFEDQPSSPRSPLSPKKPWQARENNREFNRGDNNNMFSIGQTLRIRIGPLKGYLCRVIALRRSDVTVKLDSQQKVLTVKCEHLSEVQGKSSAFSTSGGPDSSSSKPFDLLGTEGTSGGWMGGVGTSTGGGGWNAGGTSSERGVWSNSAPSFLKPESTSIPISSEGAEHSAWETKNTTNQNSSWGATVEKSGIASDPDQSGGWGKEVGNPTGASVDAYQDSGWKNKPNKDGSESASWETKNNWNAPISSSLGKSGWNQKPTEEDKEKNSKDQGGWNVVTASDGSTAGFSEASGWKKGSSEGAREGSNWDNIKSGSSTVSENQESDWGKASNWNSVSGDAGGNQGNGWGHRSNWKSGSMNDSIEKTSDRDSPARWDQGGTKSGSADGPKQATNWVSWKASSGNEKQNSDWNSTLTGPGNQDSNLGKKSNWNSGNSGNQDSDPNKSNWNSGSGDSNQTSNWENNGNWNSKKSSWDAENGNKNSNCSSRHTDPGNQDSKWGKKSNWNSGNSGNQASDPNNRNWNSGSGDSNQNSNCGISSNWNSNKSTQSAGNEIQNSKWCSGHADIENKDSSWGKKSYWNSGSSDTNQNTGWRSNGNWNTGNASSGDKLNGVNESSNENSDDGVGGGNWRGGYRGRGGFRGRGFRGRGERGGFGGRGERGGFGGRGERGGFGGRGERGGSGGRGRGRSDREGFGGRWGSDSGFGGRGRGSSDQSGGWNNGRDSGEEGSSDWKKGADNVEGWKNSNVSGAWNQDTGDKKDGQSWSQGNADARPSWNQGGGSKKQWQSWNQDTGDRKDGQSWSQGNADKECPSWNKGGGSNKQLQSWSQDTGDKKDGQSWSQGNADKERPSWNQGGGSNKQCQSWNQDSGEKKNGQSWSHGNANKECPSWNQEGGSNKQWQSGNSASAGWTSHGEHGSSWKKSTTLEETSIQEGGWNKGSNSNTTSRGWNNQDMGRKGTAVSGSAGETGDRVLNWGQSSAANKGQSSAANKGQSSSWKESADDGAAGSWGKKNDGSDKGGW